MDSTTACITDWITRQRWYGGKGKLPRLRPIGSWSLPSDSADITIRTLLLMDDAAGPPVLYQVPVTERAGLLPGAGQHLIGRLDSGAFLYDGLHDPACTAAMLALVIGEHSAEPEGAEAAGRRAVGDDTPVHPGRFSAAVLDGEQSNTSVIYSAEGERPIILKTFRAIHHGENPDVTLQTALADSGSRFVPRAVGSIVGEWDDDGRHDGRASGDLAFAQEFLPGARDAWRLALDAATASADFTPEARELGEATAEVHRSLAELFPTHAATPGDSTAVVLSWHQRLAVALMEVPAIAEHRDEIEAVFDTAQSEPWPAFQRIHGDYHLGQVLQVPGRGWVLVDFEGEPLRPMSERNRADTVLRDAAGMLRSFDYAAGAVALADPSRSIDSLRPWASAARWAFLEGYLNAATANLARFSSLLDAFELDKAIYEAVYEGRNRPGWQQIPLLGISRLLHREEARTRVG